MIIKQILKRKHVQFVFILFWAECFLFSQRIVTLAPALTEIVFTLGKGKQIVGNTRFCDYPAEAGNIAHVGGIIDLNLETVVSLKPDIVFLYPEVLSRLEFLKKRVKLVVVPHNSLHDLYNSIEIISHALSLENQGLDLIKRIKEELNGIPHGHSYPKKCLVIAGRNANDFRNMYIVGKYDFLNEILEICGGKNVYQGSLAYPLISLESIISLNPDYVFEISALYEGIERNRLLGLWRDYDMVSAVRNNKIFFIKNSAWLRPGPRVASIAKEMYQLIAHD